jgi:hypothetical protein
LSVTTGVVLVVVVPSVDGTKVELVTGDCVVLVVSGTVVVVVASVVVVAGSVARVVAVTTGARVVAVVPDGRVAGVVAAVVLTAPVVVDVAGSVELVDCGMVTRVVVVTRTVVVGDCVATCCFGELSVPVVTSNSRATRAIDART